MDMMNELEAYNLDYIGGLMWSCRLWNPQAIMRSDELCVIGVLKMFGCR